MLAAVHGQGLGSCLTSAFQFAIAFPGSPKFYSIVLGGCKRTAMDVNPPGCQENLQGWGGEGLETPHWTTVECFWQTLTHPEVSLESFWQKKKRPMQLIHCSWSQCHLSIDYSCGFRQIAYLFLAPFSYKVRTPIAFSSGLSAFKVEESQEHLNRSQWICKNVKAGETSSGFLWVHFEVRCPWLCLQLPVWYVYNTWHTMSWSQQGSLDDPTL